MELDKQLKSQNNFDQLKEQIIFNAGEQICEDNYEHIKKQLNMQDSLRKANWKTLTILKSQNLDQIQQILTQQFIDDIIQCMLQSLDLNLRKKARICFYYVVYLNSHLSKMKAFDPAFVVVFFRFLQTEENKQVRVRILKALYYLLQTALYRQRLFQLGFIKQLINKYDVQNDDKQRELIIAILGQCVYKKMEMNKKDVKFICQALKNDEKQIMTKIFNQCIYSLCEFTKNHQWCVQILQQFGLMDSIFKLILVDKIKIAQPLRVLSKMVSKKIKVHHQFLLIQGVNICQTLLFHHQLKIRFLVCYIIYKIYKQSNQLANKIRQSKTLIQKLSFLLQHDKQNIKDIIFHIINNILQDLNFYQIIQFLLQSQYLEWLLRFTQIIDKKYQKIVCKSIKIILINPNDQIQLVAGEINDLLIKLNAIQILTKVLNHNISNETIRIIQDSILKLKAVKTEKQSKNN